MGEKLEEFEPFHPERMASRILGMGDVVSLVEKAAAPYQNATGLQVSSAALAGMVWALENPLAGIVEADEVDYRRCLEVQLPDLVRSSASTPTGRRSKAAPDFFPRISISKTPGSSKIFWCAKGRLSGAQKYAGARAKRSPVRVDARKCARFYALAACLRGTPSLSSSAASSPDWNISRVMSQPPMNSLLI